MYILTFESFVDIFSFESLMLAYNKGQANFYHDKESLKNGIISACPITERNMKAYKLKGDLVDISLDNIKPFNKFNNLILDKHLIFNENSHDGRHLSYLNVHDWFKQFIINFYTDEDNRSTIVFALYTLQLAENILKEVGVEYVIINAAIFVFFKSEEEIYELLMYLSINDIETYKNLLKYYSFDNYVINCTNINLE